MNGKPKAKMNYVLVEFQELKNEFAALKGEFKGLKKAIYSLWVPFMLGLIAWFFK